MGLFEGGPSWEDHVCATTGLVDIHIHRHHELERVERLVETGCVGSGQHRVTCDRDQRPDLAFALRENLIGHRRHGQLPNCLWEVPNSAAESSLTERPTSAPPRLVEGEREHGPARAVEVGREHIQHIDRPRRERPEFDGVSPDPSVNAGRGCCRQLAGDATCRLGIDPGERRSCLRAEPVDCDTQLVDPCNRYEIVSDKTFGEQHVNQRRKPSCIGTGADPDVFVCELGRFGPTGIDDNESGSAIFESLQSARPVGSRSQAPVRFEWVRSEDQQIVGPIDVGNGNRRRMTEHVSRGDVLGHLIDRRCGVDIPRAESLGERPNRQEVVESVCVRVTDIHRDCVAT